METLHAIKPIVNHYNKEKEEELKSYFGGDGSLSNERLRTLAKLNQYKNSVEDIGKILKDLSTHRNILSKICFNLNPRGFVYAVIGFYLMKHPEVTNITIKNLQSCLEQHYPGQFKLYPDDERYIKEYTSGAFGSQYSLLSSHGSSIHDSLGFGGTLKVRSTDKKILSYVEVIHEKNSLKSGKKPSFSSLFWLRYENSGKITVSDIKDMGGMDMVFKLLNTEEKDKQPKKIVKICNNIQSVKNYEKVATSLKEFNKKNASCKFICGELVTSNKDSIEIKKGVIEYIKNKLKDKNLKTEIIQKYQSLLKDLQGDLNVEQCNRPYNLSVMTIDNLQRNKNDDDMSNIFDKLKNTRSNRLTATLVMKILNEMNLEALKLLYELNLPIYDNKFENCFVQFKDNINDLEVLKDNNNNITDYYNKFCAMIESVNIIDIVDGLSFNNDDSLYQLNYGTPDYQPPKSFLLQEKKKNQKNHNSKPKDMFLLRSLYPVIKQGMMLAYDKQKYFENLIELDKNKKYFGDINAEILIKYFSDENSDEALLKLPVFNQLNV